MLPKPPALSRFCRRPFFALLPAAIAGAVFAYYSPSSVPAGAAAAPAGVEMMQMVRDEHALIAGYLAETGERRQQADLAAEQEILQAKAAERAELMAAHEAKQATTLAVAAQAAEKVKRRVAVSQIAPASNKAAVAMPLPLVQMADAAAPAMPLRNEEGPIRARLRHVTAAVKRIPGWAHSVAEWISDAVPSGPFTQLPDLNILRVSS